MNWTQLENTLFICFARLFWSSGIGVITLACFFGYIPIVADVLGHWVWNPLVKLTYGAYLLHPTVIKLFADNSVDYPTFSMPTLLSSALFYFVAAYTAAVPLYCLV